jgi:hypothetical protein
MHVCAAEFFGHPNREVHFTIVICIAPWRLAYLCFRLFVAGCNPAIMLDRSDPSKHFDQRVAVVFWHETLCCSNDGVPFRRPRRNKNAD